MAEIKPFRGLLYNGEKVNITKAVTPPYDVISPGMQARFYNSDPHNVIRLILGKEGKKDTPRKNKYTRSAAFLRQWTGKKVLIKDARPAVYIYAQEYFHKGKKRRRIGFIALMKIEDPKKSGILPHEYTLNKPKADRMSLITETEANLSPIFCLFQDRDNGINRILKSFIKSKKALFTVRTEGVTHRLWRAGRKSVVRKITGRMRGRKIFIADGHHRYEVALAYRNKARKSKGYKKNAEHVMVYFSNLSERQNLTILSTHRVVKNIPLFRAEKVIAALKKYFLVKRAANADALLARLEKTPKNKYFFGAYTGGKSYLLSLKRKYSAADVANPGKSGTLQRLDVTILHDLVIDKILGVKNRENSIKYARDKGTAVSLVKNGGYEAAFFLRPTRVSEMTRIARKGVMMPQKSTYFYPKLLTGLVINKF